MTGWKSTRRNFMTGFAAAGLLPYSFNSSQAAGWEGPPEVTTLRFAGSTALCNAAPQLMAEDLLRAEGFTDVRVANLPGPDVQPALDAGNVNFAMGYASQFIAALDSGARLTLLTGLMVGCFELFGNDRVRGIGDLKGKSIGVQAIGSLPHTLATLMAAQVGLDPKTDIRWVTDPDVKPIELFASGRIDAFLGFPPEPQELRERKVGHVLVNTALDRPWSQYFCCLLAGNREFVQKYPIATKRAVRAYLKATDLCASEPARAAQQLVNRTTLTKRYDYALQTLTDNPYKWRDYDPEDTIRFYSLRLHEVGLIKTSPHKLIAEGTDWRFVNELKRELKA